VSWEERINSNFSPSALAFCWCFWHDEWHICNDAADKANFHRKQISLETAAAAAHVTFGASIQIKSVPLARHLTYWLSFDLGGRCDSCEFRPLRKNAISSEAPHGLFAFQRPGGSPQFLAACNGDDAPEIGDEAELDWLRMIAFQGNCLLWNIFTQIDQPISRVFRKTNQQNSNSCIGYWILEF